MRTKHWAKCEKRQRGARICGSWPREHRRGSAVSLASSCPLQKASLGSGLHTWPGVAARGCRSHSIWSKPAELNADSAWAARPHFERELWCGGVPLQLTRCEQQQTGKQPLRNDCLHQLSSDSIKTRGNGKLTFAGYTAGTLQVFIAAELKARGLKASTSHDICHWGLAASGWKRRGCCITIFSLY